MRIRVVRFVVVLAAAITVALGVRAQTAAPSTAAKPADGGSAPDLSGVWLVGPGSGDVFDLYRAASMQPWAQAKFNSEKNQHGPNVVLDFASNTDPNIRYCDPLGVPRVLLANHPFKIVQTPDEVILLYERSHDFREVYMDGRKHPEDLDPSWWGHSIGHWDGNTLVVDSVGFNDKTWLDYAGLPHTEALHVVERYTRVDHDTLRLEIEVDDPKTFTKPFTVTRVNKLKSWDIGEDICTISGTQHFEQGIVDPASKAPAK